MPYYFGEDSPGWDDYMERAEAENLARPPRDRFIYMEPWEARTSVLRFPRTPPTPQKTSDSQPATPQRAAVLGRNRSLWERFFGARPQDHGAPRATTPERKIEIGSDEWIANFHAEQKRKAEESLTRIAIAAAAFREAGVRRILLRYDGGNDEGFTHFEAFEMADARRLTRESREAQNVVAAAARTLGDGQATWAFKEIGHLDLLDDAAIAFLGPGFGTGPYEMYGAITIDLEACTMTDESDASRAFPPDIEKA